MRCTISSREEPRFIWPMDCWTQISTTVRKPRFTLPKRLLTSWLISLNLIGKSHTAYNLRDNCTRSKEVTNIWEWETTCAGGEWYVWVSISELALEWVTMDNTFINRAGVGGGWSHTYSHTCIYSDAYTIQKYPIAKSRSVLLVILYISYNSVLLWIPLLHTEEHWENTAVAMITYLNTTQRMRRDNEIDVQMSFKEVCNRANNLPWCAWHQHRMLLLLFAQEQIDI